jgi:cytochrome b
MSARLIKVWDPFVRLFHWSLAIAFFVAYFTEPEDSSLALHVWAGYFIGGLIVLRVIWGFIGTKHARFTDFAFGPFHAIAYLADLVRGRAKRHLGHSPAGAWMVYLLLVALAATVLTGMTLLAAEKHQGPLAPLFTSSVPAPTAIARGDREHTGVQGGGSTGRGEDVIEEAHEILANLALILVVLHILGVVIASVAHRENLVRAMVTGTKRRDATASEDLQRLRNDPRNVRWEESGEKRTPS